MSRGLGPLFAIPTLSHNWHIPIPSARRFSAHAARRSSPPETPAVPARSPFDSTVRDFLRFPAPEDAKCIKITHGVIEIRRVENG